MKTLVVDDFATMRGIIKNLLKQINIHDIDECPDGSKALKLLAINKYDFVITDWNMPHLTGIELLQAIRSDPKTAELPVLMMTAESTREQIVAAAEAGVDGYILKPFNAAELQEKMQKILSRRQP